MGHRQLPFEFLDYSYQELTDEEHELLNYFTLIGDHNIQSVFDRLYVGRGPRGFETRMFLAQILKVKENFLSDRALETKLLSNSIYRFCCGFKNKNDVPAFNSYTSMRKRLTPQGYIDIHKSFVNQAYDLGILNPGIPGLPKNRKPGIILIADSTFLYAHCSKSATKQEDGTLLFKDLTVKVGRPHHKYKFAAGHRVQTLQTVNGIPLVSLVVDANRRDMMYLAPLLEKFIERFPHIEAAYIILDKDYDLGPIHRAIYEDYGIIPVIIRKENIKYPPGFRKDGTPVCKYGYLLRRKGVDYKRKRTAYACNYRCLKEPAYQEELFVCDYRVDRSNKQGFTFYTHFRDDVRLYGPATPNSYIYQKLKPFRTGIERTYALVKENRYRMQVTLNYEGFEAVSQHIILFDIVLVQDAIFKFLTKGHGKNLNY